jgi:hypothetical protein
MAETNLPDIEVLQLVGGMLCLATHCQQKVGMIPAVFRTRPSPRS